MAEDDAEPLRVRLAERGRAGRPRRVGADWRRGDGAERPGGGADVALSLPA